MKYSVGEYLLCIKAVTDITDISKNAVLIIEKNISVLDIPGYKVKILSHPTNKQLINHISFIFEPDERHFIKITEDQYNIMDILE